MSRITECKAQLFADGTNHIWTLCKECAKLYSKKNSPIQYLGEGKYSEVLSCDKCKGNLLFEDDQHYASTEANDTQKCLVLSLMDPEDEDTDPGPITQRKMAEEKQTFRPPHIMNKVRETLGL